MKSIIYQTAGSLAKAIQNREVSSEEVVRVHLAHINKYNDELNAIVILLEEEAIKKAKDADSAVAKGEVWGPLHGVPITVKEAFDMKGLKTTVNFQPLENNIALEDSLIVARLKKAGGIILGKTNVPIAVADYQTDGPIYGRTNNPFNHNYTPGGSTGGGAAAVAAGLSPLEIGSDIGGSIRLPSHFCGLYGLKPTENTVPGRGHVPPLPGSTGGVGHMGCFGPLARSSDDLKLAFDIIKGPDYRDVGIAPIQWKSPSGKTLSEYHLAWSDTFAKNSADKETCSLLRELAGKISDKGGSITNTNPSDFNFKKVWETWGYILGRITGQDMSADQRKAFIEDFGSRFKGPGAEGLIKGIDLDFTLYNKTIKSRHGFIAKLQDFFDEYDFWLCPVAMRPAFRHKKSEDGLDIDGREVDYHSACGAFITVFNVTGHPALIIPLGQSSDGLPIGLQIVGPYWSEPELFHFAEQLSGKTQGFKAPEGYTD